jgi:hypothetical protein
MCSAHKASPQEITMLYRLNMKLPSLLAAAPVSGAVISPQSAVQFVPWQPSAWPQAPHDDHEFVMVLKRIFELSILFEVSNVMEDATAIAGTLEHRGHVIAISLFCALDAISSYGYGRRNGKQIPAFVREHFPALYRQHAKALLHAYRHAMVHSWNLFSVAITMGDEPVTSRAGVTSFGLRNFYEALKGATEDFLERLRRETALMISARTRYETLRRTAR